MGHRMASSETGRKKTVSVARGGLIRSIASEWAAFEQHGGITEDTSLLARAEMRMVFYAGFRSCFAIMDQAMMSPDDVGFADLATWAGAIGEEIERFRQEMIALAEKQRNAE
jgi:hypothetical protein